MASVEGNAWVIPVVVGLAAGLAAWLITSGMDGGVDEKDEEADEDRLVYVFPEGAVVPAPWPGLPATVLAIDPEGNDAFGEPGAQEAADAGAGLPPGAEWWSPFVVAIPTENGDIQCIRTPCDALRGPTLHQVADEGAPVLGEGHEAANATLYAFNTLGHVVASNAPPQDLARFTLDGDFLPLTNGTWYLGEGEAPEGTQRLPEWVRAIARPLLEGLPEGGVATLRADDHEYAWLTGELYVTARVDRLMATG